MTHELSFTSFHRDRVGVFGLKALWNQVAKEKKRQEEKGGKKKILAAKFQTKTKKKRRLGESQIGGTLQVPAGCQNWWGVMFPGAPLGGLGPFETHRKIESKKSWSHKEGHIYYMWYVYIQVRLPWYLAKSSQSAEYPCQKKNIENGVKDPGEDT